MKTFTKFGETVEQLLGGARCVQLTVDGYMPLVAEEIGPSADGRRLVALSHTAVQNGDLMRDPEIVFEFFEDLATAPAAARVMTRAVWSKKHRDYASFTDGAPHLLEVDATTGATVLVPVWIVDPFAEPISIRNDYLGTLDEVYAYDDAGRRTGVYAKRRADLISFTRIWFRNIRAQGFLGEKARREVIT